MKYLVPLILLFNLFSNDTCSQQAGTLDSTFSENGITVVNTSLYSWSASAILQDDGKIVSTGSDIDDTGIYKFGLIRLNIDGSLDTTFSNDGKVITLFGNNLHASARSVLLQPDYKIVVGGWAQSTTSWGHGFALARYYNNGTIDSSFGVGGKIFTDATPSVNDHIMKIILQPDGEIIAIGNATLSLTSSAIVIIRYNSDGGLDSTFGNNGIITTDIDSSAVILSAIRQPDGKIVMCGGYGSGSYNSLVIRFNSDGMVDSTFANDGYLIWELSDSTNYLRSITLQPDGKIVCSGFVTDSNGISNFALVRFDINGFIDSLFGVNGLTTTNFIAEGEKASAVAIQSDEKIVVGGNTDYNISRYAIARYNSNGVIDDCFGTNGKIITQINSSNTESSITSVLIQSDDKIIAAGSISNNASGHAFVRYTNESGCGAPNGVSISNITSTSAYIHWPEYLCTEVFKYRVRVKNMSTGVVNLYIVNAPDTFKLLNNISPNTTYQVKVRSQCSNNGSVLSSWSSTISFTTLGATTCIPPTNIIATPTSNSAATISWTPISGAAGYHLRYKISGASSWTLVIISNGSTSSYNLTGLTANTTYKYQLRTKCSVSPLAWSNFSSIQTFTTPLRLGEQEIINSIQLYPNPSNGTVTFNSNDLVGTLYIYDIVGKQILHQVVSENEIILTDLPNGLLTYKFITENGLVETDKFVVIR